MEDKLWHEGPEFLIGQEGDWPTFGKPITPTVDEEVHQILLTIERNDIIRRAECVSKWRVLVRAIARVFRFGKLSKIESCSEITEEEELSATKYIVKATQKELQGRDLKGLSPAKGEDDLIRMQSRLARLASVPYDMKFPIILPMKHPVTRLIFSYYHVKMGHRNFQQTLCEIRKRGFVCNRMRRELNFVIRNCNECIFLRARPEQPEMGLLPAGRVAVQAPPFSHTGVDYFGPMMVTIGRRKEKRWGVIFVSLTTRAVHIEVAHSLSALSCCMAIDNFISLRRMPLEIYSDNGTNFIATARIYCSRDGR